MLATVSIACYNNFDATKMCVENLASHTQNEVRWVFTNNASSDNTTRFLESVELPGEKLILHYGVNRGYQDAHNEAFLFSEGTQFFIIMNNDVIIKDEQWLNKLIEPFIKNPKIAFTGPDSAPATLKNDGNGMRGKRVDYIEGSLLCGRVDIISEYGLFDPALKMFFYEDSDVSLRYRQMGFEVQQVQMHMSHARGGTMNKMDKKFVQKIRDHNRRVWMGKWSSYTRNLTFTNRILLKAKSDGIGDILAITPVIEAIRRDHPTAEIVMETNHPEVFMYNETINKIANEKMNHKQGFDRTIDLMGINFGSEKPFYKEAEHIACTKVDDGRPIISLKNEELDAAYKRIEEVRAPLTIEEEQFPAYQALGFEPLQAFQDEGGGVLVEVNRPIVVVNTLIDRANWEGKNWCPQQTEQLFAYLNEIGYFTVQVGRGIEPSSQAMLNLANRTTLRQYFATIAVCDIFIGVDSLGMHVAQALGKESYIIFGATEPMSKILDFSHMFLIRNEAMACIGCYQKKKKPGYNKCALGYEACMKELPAESVMAYLTRELDPIANNIQYLHDYWLNKPDKWEY
jgi:GT2 family glycosyltransferase